MPPQHVTQHTRRLGYHTLPCLGIPEFYHGDKLAYVYALTYTISAIREPEPERRGS